MSTAAPTTPTAVRTSTDRQQSYQRSDLPHRSQSTASKNNAVSAMTPVRSSSHGPSSRPPSASRQASNLINVARKDFEQSNVAQVPSSPRRSSSVDRHRSSEKTSVAPDTPRTHQRTSSRSVQPSRYASDSQAAAAAAAALKTKDVDEQNKTAQSATPRKRTMVTAQTGQWALGKTIGAGSMGKVKLARNMESGEQVAIKIVPRHSQDEHRTQQDRERADHSKEVRTAREAAITTLVHHPYICGMRDVVRTNYHWYMLFEYVNGGQMLDYIISHGRLKEKQARKFGRQIASALDYCHRNSIVHRDLKIENILISKTGDIKIIDFGLSNLFSPRSQLKTFCGSLYFAAPELLQAKQYTGPEVDIWSFGIVLYVLVCGKVPFDDQSMPQLHAKIKKGVVEYPPWLSTECKHIISRMLVTNPQSRASLGEIMSHPWMTKGFPGIPENHLPHREPLQLPLDSGVIEKMQGFDFGSSDYITKRLEGILESDDYQKAVKSAAKRNQATNGDGDRKRGSVFDFYQRRKSANSKDALPNPSSEAVQFGDDPVYAFSPLISIYYLVREKQEREKVEANPGALSIPQSPGQTPLKMPDLAPPEAAYTNSSTFEMAGEAPTGGRARPRARTHGEDEIGEGVAQATSQHPQTPTIQTPQSEVIPARKEGPVGGLLRRFSTRRGREGEKEKPVLQRPSLQISGPIESDGSPRKSFTVRKTRDPPPSAYQAVANNHPELLSPPDSHEGATRRSKGLGRSTSVNSGDIRRRWSTRRSQTDEKVGTESEQSSITDQRIKFNDATSDEPDPGSRQRATAMRTQSVGHSRRNSLSGRRRIAREDDVPEETDQEISEDASARQKRDGESSEALKPVYLKGLFSVSTTSSKPLTFIREDIIRVLKQLGVNYREMKGGFSCRHVPSIDLQKVIDPQPSTPGDRPPVHRRKISFAGLRGDKDRDEYAEPQTRPPPTTPRSTSRRFPPENSYVTNSEDSDDENATTRARGAQRVAGETSTHVQSDLGQSMILRFEILVVKVPFLSLHGLQFKKVDGGTWQYKKMAETILTELKL